MKRFLYFALLLGGLASCSKKEDDTPTPTPPVVQPVTLEGKWALLSQSSTDGQTTNTGTYKAGDYTIVITSTEYISYSGTQEMSRYPYSVSNNVIYVASTAPGNSSSNGLAVQKLTATALELTFPGAHNLSNFKFTNTYVRR